MAHSRTTHRRSAVVALGIACPVGMGRLGARCGPGRDRAAADRRRRPQRQRRRGAARRILQALTRRAGLRRLPRPRRRKVQRSDALSISCPDRPAVTTRRAAVVALSIHRRIPPIQPGARPGAPRRRPDRAAIRRGRTLVRLVPGRYAREQPVAPASRPAHRQRRDRAGRGPGDPPDRRRAPISPRRTISGPSSISSKAGSRKAPWTASAC